MYSQEELNISNKSYISKDFPTLYNSAPYEGIVEYVKLTIKSTQRII